PALARACPTCAAGDPVLAMTGSEPLFAGRVRLGMDVRASHSEGEGMRADELALRGSLTWAPVDRLAVSVLAPVLLRDATIGAIHGLVLGPGEVELASRLELLRDRGVFPSHRFGVSAGIRLPTAIDQHDPQSVLLPATLQTGEGAVAPILGLFSLHSLDPWTFFASWSVRLPFASRYSTLPGPSTSASFAAHLRATTWLTLRAAVEARFDAPLRQSDRWVAGSESVAAWLAPGLLVSPLSELVLALVVRIPVASTAPGSTEGPSATFSVMLDV
ncbi:MAG: hypothetical protein K8H88_24600, partial [Sandaracinaceae bacterium]|nr:hypothetical protein [Sandaracinaceae bacterium]